MKVRHIIFSAPMVRALLDGRKTQTRRIVSPKFPRWGPDDRPDTRFMGCPHGAPGDQLWVKETWAEVGPGVVYRATDEDHNPTQRWRPSIFMPRWVSRITLEITEVRAQRLRDISKEDARAEGACFFGELSSTHPYRQDARWSMEEPTSTDQCLGTARFAFANFFNKLHGPDAWDANPWVWALTFKRIGLATPESTYRRKEAKER